MELGSKPSSSPTQKLNDVIRFYYYLIVLERDIHRSVSRSVGPSVWLIIFFLFVRRSWLLLLFSLFSLCLISKMEHGRENETIRRNRKRKKKKLSFWEFKNETFFSAEGHRPEQCTEIMKSNFTVPLPTEVGSWLNHFFFSCFRCLDSDWSNSCFLILARLPWELSRTEVERFEKGEAFQWAQIFKDDKSNFDVQWEGRILFRSCLLLSRECVHEPQCLTVRTWTAMPVCPYIQDAYLKGE